MRHGSKDTSNRGSNGGTTRLPAGKQWLPHQGMRERLRRARQAWVKWGHQARVDSYTATTHERLMEHAAEHAKDADAGEVLVQGVVLAAITLAADKGVSWAGAVNVILNEMEEQLDKARPLSLTGGVNAPA